MQSLVHHEEEKVDAAKCLDPATATEKTVVEENVKVAASTAPVKDIECNEAAPAENENSQEEEEEENVESLIEQADSLYKDDKLLASARILRRINNIINNNTDLLTQQHHEILQQASDCESLINQLIVPPVTTTTTTEGTTTSEEWTKLGESHDGKHNSIIYYQQPNSTTFKTRIETPIPSNLLVPILSVLNETDLYSTWLPYWKIPFRLGVSDSIKLQQSSRVSQIIQVKVDVPFPFAKREVIIKAVSLDDIEETGRIAIRMTTPESDGEVVPHSEKGVMRQEFEGGFLFCKCPLDHPALKPDERSSEEDDKILVYFSVTIQDDKLHLFPQAVINFVTRIVLKKMWDMFLRVAEEVKDGKRPQHSEKIEEKRVVLYDWVEERICAMFERLKDSEEEEEEEAEV